VLSVKLTAPLDDGGTIAGGGRSVGGGGAGVPGVIVLVVLAMALGRRRRG
jgi:MYXO-CTERM domain-containing protein